MQLRLDAADRLVELVEERRGPVVAEEAARRLFALRQAPVALARALLAEVVEADARLAWNGDAVALARAARRRPPARGRDLRRRRPRDDGPAARARRRSARSARCKIVGFEIVDEFETLVDPRVPLGPRSRR